MRIYVPRRLTHRTLSHIPSPLCIAKRNNHHHHDQATAIDWRRNIAEKNAAINALSFVAPTPSPGANDTANLPLHGQAIAIKNNIATAELPTTCSSLMLKDYTSPFDATVVKLLKEAGADIVGKTNCDEFGMGSLNIHSIYGSVVNPFSQNADSKDSPIQSLKRSAGGSSGGSAAAVAAGMCYAALGTDTGGSTRLPASYCGIVGHKPSYGLISRWGVVSFADSLDCVGVMGANVDSVEKVFNILSKYDPKDPTSASPSSRKAAWDAAQARVSHWDLRSLSSSTSSPPSSDNSPPIRIGIPQEYFPATLSPALIRAFRRTLRSLAQRFAGKVTFVPVSLPATEYALSAYYVLASAEASSNLARYDGVRYGTQVPPPPGTDTTKTAGVYAQTRTYGFGDEVKKRILLGTYALSADAFDNYFLQAQRVRQLVKDDYNRVLSIPDYLAAQPGSASSTPTPTPTSLQQPHGRHSGAVDVLVHPSAVGIAPPLGAPADYLDAYVQDVLTVPASLAGLPAVSVPAKVKVGAGTEEDGWPVGVSVVGQWGCDGMVLEVAKMLEAL